MPRKLLIGRLFSAIFVEFLQRTPKRRRAARPSTSWWGASRSLHERGRGVSNQEAPALWNLGPHPSRRPPSRPERYAALLRMRRNDMRNRLAARSARGFASTVAAPKVRGHRESRVRRSHPRLRTQTKARRTSLGHRWVQPGIRLSLHDGSFGIHRSPARIRQRSRRAPLEDQNDLNITLDDIATQDLFHRFASLSARLSLAMPPIQRE